jgi:hypothetical protein
LPTSDTRPRIRLPSDLSRSLKYLDDAELRQLKEAVDGELERRSSAGSREKANQPGHRIKEAVQVPEGKANLIRASFKAGLKPPAIARTLRISQSLVRRVLSSAEKREG